MNMYYHDFSFGFNWWYLLLPLQLILMVVVGFKNVDIKKSKRTGKEMVVSKFTDLAISIFAFANTAAFIVLFYIESDAGIIQWFDNGLDRYESGVYSLLAAGFTYVVVFFTVWMIYTKIALAVENFTAKIYAIFASADAETARKNYFSYIRRKKNHSKKAA